MKTMVYKLPNAYEIFTSDGKLFYVFGKHCKYIGSKKTHVSNGKLVRDIPDEIKQRFFNIQRKTT